MDQKEKKTPEHIWQPEKFLVITSWPFLLPITNFLIMKSNFQSIFDNSHFLQNNFLDELAISLAIY